MMRKTIGAVTVVAMGGLALAGCSSGSDDGLTWSMWVASNADQEAWAAVGAAGSEAAGEAITLQGSPFNDYWTKISTQLGTDAAPCIVSMQSLRLNQFTDGLMPLDELIEESDLGLDGFDSGALKALEHDGQQYALPYDTGPLVLFYNRDMFSSAGVDEPQPGWNVEQFEAAAQKLKDDGKIAFASSVEDLYLEASVLAYNGGRVIDENGSYDLSSPEFEAGVEWLAGLVADGYSTRADGADASADDNAFVSGVAASVVAGPWQLLDFKDKSDFDIGVATVPAGESGQATFSAGSGFGISTTCDDPEAAFDAIAEMTSEEVLSQLAQDGRAFPARTGQQGLWLEHAGIEGAGAALESASASAVPLPGSDQSEQFNQLLAQYGAQMLNGTEFAASVLSEISDELGD